MIYQLNSSAVVKSLDLAVAILKGRLDFDTVPTAANNPASGGFAANIISPWRPSNVQDADRSILSMSDSDTSAHVQTQQKSQRGHFFLTVAAVGSAPADTLANAMNEIRKICDNVQGVMVKFSGATTNYICVYGFIKVDQTQDYDVLGQINAALKADYVQINPADVPA